MRRERNQGKPVAVDRIEEPFEDQMPDRGRRETPTVRFSLGRAQRLFSAMGGSCMRYLMRFVLLGMVSVNLSWGQTAEAGVTVGWSAFTDSNIGGPDPQSGAGAGEFSLNNGIRIGSRLAINTWQFLGHELSYAFQRSGLQIGGVNSGGMSIQNFYYNFVVHATPQGTAVRPFVTAGAGFSTFFPPGISSFSGAGTTKPGVNIGGGLKFKLRDRYGVRFDVRDHVTGKPFGLPGSSGSLHNVEYSAGFSLLF